MIRSHPYNPLDIAREYISEEVSTPEDAIQGASDIVAEIVSDSADFVLLFVSVCREGRFYQSGTRVDNEHKDQFLQYNEYAEPVRQMPSYFRILSG